MNLNMLFYILLLVVKTSFSQECSSDGINCISCTEYRNCSVAFPEGRVFSCRLGESCTDDQLKQCQMKLNCYALNECTQAGIFPDVMVDSNYYVCLNDASSGFLKYEFTCPEGNFFDKASLTCVPREVTLATTEVPSSSSVSIESTTSSSPTEPTTTSTTSTSSSTSTDPNSSTSTGSTSPSTSTDLTSSTSSSTPSSTTSSTSISPSTDPTTSTSVSSTSSSTDPTTSTSVSSTSSSTDLTTSTSVSSTSSTTPTTPTVPSSTTPGPFACMASGIFPNPDNCKMYYRCSTSLTAFIYICPGNSYFNENILKCSMIISPACQEQILKNSTTIPPSTTTAVTTTTTSTTVTTLKPTTTSPTTTTPTTTTSTTTSTAITPAPTTTTTIPTTTTTTTTPLSTTPFSCPMSGTFANPSDCKTYYRCSLSGKIFQYVCPGNTYFNEFTKRCSLIVTPRCRNLIQG